ncbi:pro-corazonin-like [Bacillus rossius redtenbacheri]|uniref:pro-corazonin-like n=1 Tax=Bacillus rossius redtenbacheri TaxID=93214 RepID=UPI002FDF0414
MALHTSLLLVLACMVGVVLAQTFQYSHGWTNGRKRSGGSPRLEEPVVERAEPREGDPDPCQAAWVKYVVAERDGQQMYIPCMLWRNLREQ